MELLLSQATIDALRDDQRDADRAQAERAVDQLLAEIETMRARIADVATEDGARQMAAAIFLVRAAGLLREVRNASDAPVLAVLGVRSIFELAVVGRYLLASPNGPDEFRRRYNFSVSEDAKLAAQATTTSAPPANFLVHLIDGAVKSPRGLVDMARELDVIDARKSGDTYSLQACYRLLHKFVSNSGSHANLSSVKRHSQRDGDVLRLESDPDPIFREVPVLLVATIIGDLARAVFTTMDLPTGGLPTEIVRPGAGEPSEAL